MGHIATSFLYQLADILHHLMGLFCWVVAVNIFCVIQILWALATHPNSASTACHNSLTQIIVKILFGVCVFGIEFTNTLVRHLKGLLEVAYF
jgi:NAD/NADP transhydrogenase beta subunit